jgi:hypothetical protein
MRGSDSGPGRYHQETLSNGNDRPKPTSPQAPSIMRPLMVSKAGTESFTNIVLERDREALELFGPSVQSLIAPQSSDEAPCVMKGTIPPGVSVSMHSHPEIDAFFVLSGDVEVLSVEGGKAHWIAVRSGHFIRLNELSRIIDPQGAQRCCESRSTIYRWPPCTGDANPLSRSLGGGRLK